MNNGNMDSKIPVVVVFLVLCSVLQVHAAVANCTASGRFADITDSTCKNYTYCVYDSSSGNYLGYYYRCPTTSLFNPNTQRCTTAYTCNNTSSDLPVPELPACVDEGFYEDESSTDCTGFIGCVALGGTFIESKYTCATGTYFDPTVGDCTFDYICPSTCTAAGRFPNTADTTCKTFYSCVLAPNGTYVQTEYTCPSTSLFNPTTKLCSTTYTCK